MCIRDSDICYEDSYARYYQPLSNQSFVTTLERSGCGLVLQSATTPRAVEHLIVYPVVHILSY